MSIPQNARCILVQSQTPTRNQYGFVWTYPKNPAVYHQFLFLIGHTPFSDTPKYNKKHIELWLVIDPPVSLSKPHHFSMKSPSKIKTLPCQLPRRAFQSGITRSHRATSVFFWGRMACWSKVHSEKKMAWDMFEWAKWFRNQGILRVIVISDWYLIVEQIDKVNMTCQQICRMICLAEITQNRMIDVFFQI